MAGSLLWLGVGLDFYMVSLVSIECLFALEAWGFGANFTSHWWQGLG